MSFASRLPRPTTRFAARAARAHRSRGFALVELIIAISIAAALAIYANRQSVEASYESLTVASAEYLSQVGTATERLILNNINDYTTLANVPGVANDLQPTLAELQAAGLLRAGFPTRTPTRQQVRIDITRTGCPGAACDVRASVCTTTPIRFNDNLDRLDLAATMYEALEGRGGLSIVTTPGTITSPTGNFANPNGNVAGIVCHVSSSSAGPLSQFVRINDNRDPNLQGNLTVAGNATVGGNAAVTGTLQVTGNSTLQGNLAVNGQGTFGPCVNIAGGAQGRAGFGCDNPNDVPAGWTGGVRSNDVVADTNILVSSAPGTFTGTNTNYALLTANNGSGQAEVRTSGRVAANRLTPQGQFAVGAACAAADEGSIARLSGGTGLVVCAGGTYRLLNFAAASGDVCTTAGATAVDGTGRTLLCVANPNGVGNTFRPFDQIVRAGTPNTNCTTLGATAIDFATGGTLICRFNLGGGTARWMRLQDVTSHLQFVGSTEVAPNATVTKPVCNAGAGGARQIIQLIPKVWGSPDGGQAFFAVDNGGSWTVRLRDGTGNNLQGSPNAAAIAQVFCYFP